MATEQDAGQAGKKGALLLVVGVVALAVIGYIVLSWLHRDTTLAHSAVDLHGVGVTTRTPTTETEHYRELLKTDNDRGATEALKNHRTFLASLPQGVVIPDPPTTTPPPGAANRKKPETVATPATPVDRAAARQQQQQDRDAREKLKALLQRMRQNTHTDMTVASVPGADSHGGGGRASGTGNTANPYAAWTTSLVAATRSSIADPSSTPVVTIIPAFTRVPATIETAIDSDNTGSQVIARVHGGPFAGAIVHTATVKLVGDGVEVHFTRLLWQGQEYKVNAYALSQDTLQSSVATDVNHRYISRILLPAVLGGIGEVGSLYKSANTTILSNQYSTTTSTAMPSGKVVGGVITGGAAEKAANVLQQDAAKLPATQVTVKHNELIALQFIDGVYSTDVIRKGQSRQQTATLATAIPAAVKTPLAVSRQQATTPTTGTTESTTTEGNPFEQPQ